MMVTRFFLGVENPFIAKKGGWDQVSKGIALELRCPATASFGFFRSRNQGVGLRRGVAV